MHQAQEQSHQSQWDLHQDVKRQRSHHPRKQLTWRLQKNKWKHINRRWNKSCWKPRRLREGEEKRRRKESYSEEEEVIEEDPPKAPGAIVLKENPRKDEGKDDDADMPEESYDEGQSWHDWYDWNDWNEDDWQDRESRDYERERSQRRSKGYEKGKGKGRGKSKSKGKDKGKKGSYKGWWSPPKISEKDLMATLLKKANRHQAEWQELPRNKLTWETLKSEEGDELISVRICVKKSPRHTLMNVPPECRHWRKFSVMLPSIDEPWEECEKDAQAHDIEEFDDDKKPLLFMACLITKSCILSPEDVEEEEERTEESRTREYNSLGEVKNASAFYATSRMNAVSANLCNEGICQMFVENDLIRSSFTGDGKTAERYMALAAAAGTGELTGRKCKTWTHSNKSNLGVLILSWLQNVTRTCRTWSYERPGEPWKDVEEVGCRVLSTSYCDSWWASGWRKNEGSHYHPEHEGWKSHSGDPTIWIPRHGVAYRGIGCLAWTRRYQHIWKCRMAEWMGIQER